MIKNKLIIFLIIFFIGLIIGATIYPLKHPDTPLLKKLHNYKEKDYVNAYSKGIKEYTLPDKTRVDCLTDEYAIEFEWGRKWAEGIGQALYYAKMTDKKPAIAIIMLSPKDERYIKRIEKVEKGIKVFKIKAY